MHTVVNYRYRYEIFAYLQSTIDKHINNIVCKTIQIYIIIRTSAALFNIKEHQMYVNGIFQTVSLMSLIASYCKFMYLGETLQY